MKQLLLLGLVLAGFSASAQTEQGNFLVGGMVQLTVAKANTNIEISPNAGYFFTDNFAAGANFSLAYSKTGSGDNAFKSTVFALGPFVRYYVATPSNVRPFLQGDFNFTTEKFKQTTTNTRTGIGYFVGPGVAIFLNRNVALEGLAGYRHFAYKGEDGNGGFAFKLGFQVYLSRAEVNTVTNTVQ
jgi:hypothetical protein